VSHPDPAGPADLRPFRVGDELQNPVTGEFARILELPWENPEGRGRAELLAVVGARVLGEHVHPGMVERFTALEGELTVRLDGTTRLLPEGDTAPGDAGGDGAPGRRTRASGTTGGTPATVTSACSWRSCPASASCT